MNSPAGLGGFGAPLQRGGAAGQQLSQASSPYFSIALYAAGNVLGCCIILLVWFGWGILAAFQEPLLWAWLCSMSLRDVKRFLVSTARSELHRSSFVVCCAKLVFLPAVVAWQLIEEVRDKLAAKYQQLQLNSQQASAVSVGAAAAATAADDSRTAAAAAGYDTAPEASDGCAEAAAGWEEGAGAGGGGAAQQPDSAAGRSAAAGSSKASKGFQQVLRQRSTASKQQHQQTQQQQQNKHQRPPLGPRPTAAAANGTAPAAAAAASAAAARKHGRKGAAGGKGTNTHQPGRSSSQQPGAGAKHAAGKAAAAQSSPFQQRIGRLQDLVRQLFSSYGFIIGELLRFILGGLLPRRRPSSTAASSQLTEPRQQQQQRQQTWPANGTLTAASLPPGGVGAAAGGQHHLYAGQLPQYLDLSSCSNSTSSYPTTVAGSRADSLAGSCRSECNMPWTPHPHWQQLMLQQQQQFVQQQQQQQSLRQARLSSSSSTPSLQAAAAAGAASQHASPRGVGAAALLGVGEAATGAALQRHMTMPVVATCTSFSGWAGSAPHQHGQQGPSSPQGVTADAAAHLAGADAAASGMQGGGGSCAAAGREASSAATSGAGLLQRQSSGGGSPLGPAGALLQQQQAQRFARAASALSLSGLPAAAAAAGSDSAASLLYGPAGGLAFAHSSNNNEPQTLFLPPTLASYGPECSGWQHSASWDGLLAGRTPPASVTGAAAGSSGSSPSAVLFKGLLRGIVLFEGYRFVRGFLTAEQSLFIPLLVLAATLAVAGGLPFLLLPSSLLNPNAAVERSQADSSTEQQQQQQPGSAKAAAAAAAPTSRRRMRSPFSDAAATKTAATPSGRAASVLLRLWVCLQQSYAVVGSRVVSGLVKADQALRMACASSFLDTAVSGLIVVGLILGSVVLSAVLLVQIGDESRQAVVSVNSLVRHKSTQAGLTEGVWSLVQQYEGQLVGMTQYVLQETLPGLTLYVETRASDFLVSHNLSKVLLDWEVVRAALKLPADCGDEAKLRLAVQLANSSLAESRLGTQRQQLQGRLDEQQERLHVLAAQLEALWVNGSSSSGDSSANISSSGSSALAQDVLRVQAAVERLQEELHITVAGHEAASEQLKLAELRMHNCQPSNATSGAAAAAAGLAGAAHGRGLLSSLLGGFTASKNASAAAAAGPNLRAGQQGAVMSSPASHARGALQAVLQFDFAAAGAEVAAMLGQLVPEEHDAQQQQQQQPDEHLLQQQQLRQLHADGTCGLAEDEDEEDEEQQEEPTAEQRLLVAPDSTLQCSSNTTCRVGPPSDSSSGVGVAHAAPPALTAVAQQGSAAAAVGGGGGSSSTTTSSGSTGTSLVRVARGAAYPLITMLRHVSSLVVAGMGSGAAVALGTGLGVLRLGLGVAKFLVQLGVFASVLYTLLALDIDPVEQVVKLLPISEASQERASRAVTKALRGVFVSSLKLAAFHAGFTWLTLRAFGTHFVCTATVASAIVAVLPLVPVYLTALPGVLELVLARGAPVKGLVLLALHVGAYTFGDDLIYREIEPTLPYLVGLGVFGGMWHFSNPLQGVLLGPMVLALLSVAYNLHSALGAAHGA